MAQKIQINYDGQIQLEKASQNFQDSATLLLKSDILDGLASEIVKYKMYPSTSEFHDVAQALITKHPCLKEQGSVTGFCGWTISLKYKMSNYRTRVEHQWCQPEVKCCGSKSEPGEEAKKSRGQLLP